MGGQLGEMRSGDMEFLHWLNIEFLQQKKDFNKFAVGKVSLGKSKYVLQMSPPQRHNFLRHRFYKLCCLFNETEHALIVKFQENCRQIWASIGKVLFDTT